MATQTSRSPSVLNITGSSIFDSRSNGQTAMKSGIYCITNLVNGKVYVGQSVNIPKRWKTHRAKLRHGTGKHFHLGHAWAKYGEDNFRFTVLEHAPVDQLDALEEHYIRTLHATDSQFGYNVESKSRGRGVWTDEARARLSAMRKGVKRSAETVAKMSASLRGRKCSPDAVEKMAAAHRGIKWSDEARAKLSESRIGSKRSPESIAKGAASNRGKVLSDETRAKISAAKMGRKATDEERARMSESRKGRKRSPEAIAKTVAFVEDEK